MKSKAHRLIFGVLVCSLFSIFSMGCEKRPSEVLPEDKMVDLMVDMELAESYNSVRPVPSNKERLELGKSVLALHGVSEATIDTTLAWYGRNMDEYAALFEKIDKEINKRKEQYTDVPGKNNTRVENLWPYSEHLVISPLSGYEYFSFSIPKPEIRKGDNLEMSLYLPNSAALKGTFGVEYQDGGGEAVVTNFSSKHKLEMSLQTDSTNTVARLFGFIQLKDSNDLPLYIDSLFIKAMPFDSIDYRSKRRLQKTFAPASFGN